MLGPSPSPVLHKSVEHDCDVVDMPTPFPPTAPANADWRHPLEIVTVRPVSPHESNKSATRYTVVSQPQGLGFGLALLLLLVVVRVVGFSMKFGICLKFPIRTRLQVFETI